MIRRKGRSAVAAVEMALVAPVMVLFMLGICNLVLMGIASAEANAGAQSAALFASKNPTDHTGITEAAKANCPNASVKTTFKTDRHGRWVTIAVSTPTHVILMDGLIMPKTLSVSFTYPVQ